MAFIIAVMNNISETIFKQLGGNGFIAMTGATYLVASERGLSMRLPQRSTKNRCTHVTIKLNARDLYDVEYFKMVKFEMIQIQKFEDISVSDLRNNFTQTTGLFTSL